MPQRKNGRKLDEIQTYGPKKKLLTFLPQEILTKKLKLKLEKVVDKKKLIKFRGNVRLEFYGGKEGGF